MTNLEGLPSYFWLTSSRLKRPLRDDVPYTTEALKQDLLRVQIAWDDCQASRARDAIYGQERWQRWLGKPLPRSSLSCGNISPLGVTGTPVIDGSRGTS